MRMASEKSVDYLVRLANERTPQVGETAVRAWAATVPWYLVSEKIDWLKSLAPAPAPAAVELADGMYVMGTDVVKVQHAVHGSGKQYAKQLDRETGTFDYVPGLIGRVQREGRRMTLEDAKQFGDLYGMCCVCGRTLTNEASIEAGIGPVCSGRLAA